MDRESDMGEGDMGMRGNFKSIIKIYPPLRGSAVPRGTSEEIAKGGFPKKLRWEDKKGVKKNEFAQSQ